MFLALKTHNFLTFVLFFRQKLRGAVYDALEDLNVKQGHSLFKPCFKKLFEICKIYFKKNGFGTKEVLAEVAKDHAKQVIKNCSVKIVDFAEL